jgi:iron complex outermembrane recepter protein
MHEKRIALWSTATWLLVCSAWAAEEPPPVSEPDAGVAAAPAPAPAPVAAPAASLPEATADGYVEEVVVIGLQRSMQQAQTIKKNSTQIVDTVVAEDIGKLPDVTVSETAARIPGVQVDRARGEAAGQVLVRGLPDLTTTYNGREIFTAETRNVALGDFPAGGIAGLEVFKSTSADLIEGGLAGLINVRSRRPFDFEGFEISGALNGTYDTQAGRFDPNGNLLVTDRWKTGAGELGALLNVSFNRLNYLDSARWNTGFIGTGRTSDTGQQFRYPDVVGIFYGAGERARPSVNASAQWKPAPNVELYFDGLYQGYRDQVADRLLEMRLWGTNQYTNLTLRPGTTDQAQSLHVEGAARPFMFQGATYRKTDTFQLAVGGAFEVGPVRITADVARTTSKFDMSLLSLDQELASSPGFDVNFDVPEGPGGMEFRLASFDLASPANFNYLGFFDRSFAAAGSDWQARTDLKVTTPLSFIPTVEGGFRFTVHDAYQENGQRYCADDDGGNPGAPCLLAAGTPMTNVSVTSEVFRPGFQGSAVQQDRAWVSPTYESIRANVEALRALQGFNSGPPVRTPAFTSTERTIGGYAQARWAVAAGPVPIDGAIGLRAVGTSSSVTTTQAGEGSYLDLLPNVSARARLLQDLQVRLSFNMTRTRPGFDQLRPIILNSPPSCLNDPSPPPSCQITGGGGNPALQPVRSTNFDASVEYFFSTTGLGSLALFRRNITGFITNLDVTRDDPIYGTNRQRVNIPVNGGEGHIQGFEASLGTFLDFLPGWASGFGLYGNLTFLNEAQAFPTGFGLALGEEGRIPGVSPWSFNVAAMYEHDKIAARLSYNYRSRWITAYVQDPNSDGFTGEFVDGATRLDFSTSYDVFDKVSVTLDASNILGQPFRNFRQFTPEGATYPRDVRYEETVFSLGVRARL